MKASKLILCALCLWAFDVCCQGSTSHSHSSLPNDSTLSAVPLPRGSLRSSPVLRRWLRYVVKLRPAAINQALDCLVEEYDVQTLKEFKYKIKIQKESKTLTTVLQRDCNSLTVIDKRRLNEASWKLIGSKSTRLPAASSRQLLSSLCRAVWFNQISVASSLVLQGADPSAPCPCDESLETWHGSVHGMRDAFGRWICTNIYFSREASALHVAAHSLSAEMVSTLLLLDDRVDKQESRETLLDDTESVSLTLSKTLPLDSNEMTPLHYMVDPFGLIYHLSKCLLREHRNRWVQSRHLAKKKAAGSKRARLLTRSDLSSTCAPISMSEGAKDMLERLEFDESHFHLQSRNYDSLGKKQSRFFKKSTNVYPNISVDMPYMRHLYADMALPVLRALLSGGADIYASDSFGQSVMHRVAEGGIVLFAAEILSFVMKANLNQEEQQSSIARLLAAKDLEGQTPLGRALRRGHTDMVTFLKEIQPIKRTIPISPVDKLLEQASETLPLFPTEEMQPSHPRCDIDEIWDSTMTARKVHEMYIEAGRPVIIRRSVVPHIVEKSDVNQDAEQECQDEEPLNDSTPDTSETSWRTSFSRARVAWSPSSLASERFADLSFEASTIPYADVFGGEVVHKNIPLYRYLQYYGKTSCDACNNADEKMTTKNHTIGTTTLVPPMIFSKISAYSPLFSRAGIPTSDFIPETLSKLLRMNNGQYYNISSYQFSLGVHGSGAAWHYHTDAAAILFHGTKRWYFVDASHSRLSSTPPGAWYSGKSNSFLGSLPVNGHEDVLVCEQYPGDVVIVPNRVGHATLNVGICNDQGQSGGSDDCSCQNHASVGLTFELAGRRGMEPFHIDM